MSSRANRSVKLSGDRIGYLLALGAKPRSLHGPVPFLSLAAFPHSKREVSEHNFYWVEPLKPTIWNLFDICPQAMGKAARFSGLRTLV